MKLAVLLALLAANCYAGDWKTGTLAIQPTAVKTKQYTGDYYHSDNTGYTCVSGDSNNSPDCYKDSGLSVEENGHSVATLEDGSQYVTSAYNVFSTFENANDDLKCEFTIRSESYLNNNYQCTPFRMLTIREGGFGLCNKTTGCPIKSFTFQYKLKPKGECLEEITIKKAGKGLIQIQKPGCLSTPDAAARKQFAKSVFKSVKEPDKLGPTFNITADGPDASIYVFHIAGMTYAKCQGVFTTEGGVEELKKTGFTQYVCTDDGNIRFAFDITAAKSQRPDPPPSK